MRYSAVINSLQNLIDYQPSQAELSKILNVSRANISAKANRNSNIDDKDLALIEQHYNISFSQQNVVNNQPIKIFASCGSGVINADIDYLQLDNKQKYIYCFANGDSMETEIHSGDLLIIKVQDYIDKQNDIYCFTYENEQYVKRISRNLDQLIISSDNKKYDEFKLLGQETDKVRVIGRVVGVIRRF